MIKQVWHNLYECNMDTNLKWQKVSYENLKQLPVLMTIPTMYGDIVIKQYNGQLLLFFKGVLYRVMSVKGTDKTSLQKTINTQKQSLIDDFLKNELPQFSSVSFFSFDGRLGWIPKDSRGAHFGKMFGKKESFLSEDAFCYIAYHGYTDVLGTSTFDDFRWIKTIENVDQFLLFAHAVDLAKKYDLYY